MPKKPGLRLEYLDPRELRANPENWRQHPEGQRQALEAVIQKVGWAGALLYNERTGRLIDGHLRKEMQTNGGKVPVLIGSWSEDNERLILASLDPIAGMAEADKERLAGLLNGLSAEEAAIQGLLDKLRAENAIQAACGAQEADPGPQIDKGEELLAKWKVERGQVWEVGRHRVMCGDARIEADVIQLTQTPIDLVISSPPYQVGVSYGGQRESSSGAWGGEYKDLIERSTSRAVGHLCNGRMFVWNLGSDRRCCYPEQQIYLESLGLTMIRHMVWHKPGEPIPSWYASQRDPRARHFCPSINHEFWLILSKGKPELGEVVYMDDLLRQTVVSMGPCSALGDVPDGNEEIGVGPKSRLSRRRKVHPAPYPVRLVGAFISCLLAKGEWAYDPFLGSGSTLVACEQLGRIGYGMEIEPKYVAVTLERLSGMGLKPKMVG